MTVEESILFELIRAGLAPAAEKGEEPFHTVCSVEAPDWNSIFQLASSQGVLAITWDGLQRLSASGKISPGRLPERMLKLRWAYNVERIESRYRHQLAAAKRLAGILAEAGIRMMILKGLSLSRFYPVPEHRPCGDIDIWLYGRQHEADALLRTRMGIEVDEDKHHHTVFHIDGVMVENHFDFLNVHAHPSNRELERRLKLLASQPGESLSADDPAIFCPSPDLDALFLLRHAAGHFAAVDIGLRHVVDWALFVRSSHERVDWASLESVAERQNMHRFLHCLNAISIDCLGVSPDCFPPFVRDEALENRVLNEILHPEFSELSPQGNIVKGLIYKFRRWWANRWKHRIVYSEGLLRTFFVQFYSHLLKPKSFLD